MDWLIVGWRPVVIGLVSVAMVAAACSSDAAVSKIEPGRVSAFEPESDIEQAVGSRRELTLNVYLTDQGFEPSTIFVPDGRQVRMVVRNRGTTEHHYRIVGMEAKDLMWRVGPEDMSIPEGVSPADHDAHHLSGWAPLRLESRAGIRPLGDEVHAYAELRGDMDVVVFTATKRGTYQVECPLHSEAVGKVVVF